jgi:indoleamine 2,3-dioxygenase
MPARISDAQSNVDSELSSFISHNGFLPVKQPLKCLPNSYYEPWEDIMSHLPELLREKTIRDRIDGLDVLETSKLCTEAEWRRAYVILSFLAHGYIWGGDVPSEVSNRFFLIDMK